MSNAGYNKIVENHKKKLKKHVKDGGWFVGPRMVKAVSEDPETNTASIVYDDGGAETMLMKQWEGARSDKPYAQGEVSVRRYKHVVRKLYEIIGTQDDEAGQEGVVRGMMDVLMEENVDKNTAEWLLQQTNSYVLTPIKEIVSRIDDGLTRAMAKTFGVTREEQILIKSIHEVLMTEPPVTEDEEEMEDVEQSETPEAGEPADVSSEEPEEATEAEPETLGEEPAQ